MIERTQKKVIFEEATKKGIVGSQLLQVPEIYASLLGTTDIGVARYGSPLTPVYNAKSGELIEIPRIANFFTGMARDLRVADIAYTELENNLVLFNLEMWARMQLLKNKASDLSKRARVEKLRASLGATWVFTESFNTTNSIDMQNTTAWIDTAEGIAFLPNAGDEHTIKPQDITITEHVAPTGANFLGSNPKQAFDGLDSTNWRCLFVQDGVASAVASFATPSDITAISIDPVGFGIDLRIETDTDGSWKEVIHAIIYSKKTFPIEQQLVKRMRVSFSCATSVLPKTVGIRDCVIYTSEATRTAQVISKLLKPNDSFTEIKLTSKGELPTGSSISSFFRTSTGDPWTQIQIGDWQAITDTNNTSLNVKMTDAVAETSSINFRGLYGIQVPQSQIPLTIYEGIMDVGINMIEVTAFRKDWLETGDIPHQLVPKDFDNEKLQKTWTYIPQKAFTSQGSGMVVQYATETSIVGDSNLTKSGKTMVFQRKLDRDNFAVEDSEYNQMVICPLVGAASGHQMQYGYNYRLRYWVYAPKQFHYNGGKYWFYQGYRKANRRAYRDIGKSYGSFSFYINDTLIAADNLPYTIFDDNTTDSSLGKNYSLTFDAGWNKVDIYINVVDPSIYGTDSFDVADKPFLQLSLYPSLFDINFQENQDHPITDVVGSGQIKPISEFDLLWNLPIEPTFWAWSSDRNYVLFNTNTRKLIDGYYLGDAPNSTITFRSVEAQEVDDLYIKFVLEREQTSRLSPTLDEYSVLVR